MSRFRHSWVGINEKSSLLTWRGKKTLQPMAIRHLSHIQKCSIESKRGFVQRLTRQFLLSLYYSASTVKYKHKWNQRRMKNKMISRKPFIYPGRSKRRYLIAALYLFFLLPLVKSSHQQLCMGQDTTYAEWEKHQWGKLIDSRRLFHSSPAVKSLLGAGNNMFSSQSGFGEFFF